MRRVAMQVFNGVVLHFIGQLLAAMDNGRITRKTSEMLENIQ